MTALREDLAVWIALALVVSVALVVQSCDASWLFDRWEERAMP